MRSITIIALLALLIMPCFANVASTVEPANISLSGEGQEASQQFTLSEGLSIFTMKHSGSSNFIIQLLDNHGEYVDNLVNEIGEFDGAKAIGTAESGNYILDIDADGPWTVNISQPRSQTDQSVSEQGVVSLFDLPDSNVLDYKTEDSLELWAERFIMQTSSADLATVSIYSDDAEMNIDVVMPACNNSSAIEGITTAAMAFAYVSKKFPEIYKSEIEVRDRQDDLFAEAISSGKWTEKMALSADNKSFTNETMDEYLEKILETAKHRICDP